MSRNRSFACTYRLARSALPEARSWGLKALAAEFGIPLSHHDPLSDAQAAGASVAGLPDRSGTTHPGCSRCTGTASGAVI